MNGGEHCLLSDNQNNFNSNKKMFKIILSKLLNTVLYQQWLLEDDTLQELTDIICTF